MKAVILAAGVGSRLQTLSGGTPKCLIEIGGRPLILHQLEMLADHGVGTVTVVLGYRAADVKKVIGDRAQVLVNERYAETNSLYSLWIARELVTGPFLLLNSDLFFDPEVLDRLLGEKGSALAYDSTSSRGREQTKVAVRRGRVIDLGKDLPPGGAQGENLGVLKFDDAGTKAMLEATEQLVRAGNEDAWVIEAARAVVGQVEVAAVNVAGIPWAEIDFPYDLDVARREVWPAIWRRRYRRLAYWKRIRWLALVAAAILLASIGWYVNARVGPASKNWETVRMPGEKVVGIARGDGRIQLWIMAPKGKTVTGLVTAREVVVETRLVLPKEIRSNNRYVIAVTIDGQPHTWKVFNATRDTVGRTLLGPVGNRERVRLELPGGMHRIGVRLLDGHGSVMLVRLREREPSEEGS